MWQEIIVYIILGIVVSYTILDGYQEEKLKMKNKCEDCPLKNKCNR